MRVYCGLASAGDQLTVAVVDDCGQVAALQQIGDHPDGYAELLALLAQRADPAAPGCVPVASDAPTRTVAQLLVATGRPACFTDEETVVRLSAAEPPNAAEDARRAVAMARALYSGQLFAASVPPQPHLAALRPALAAHAALTAGRGATVTALREVLREMYPAALRAFPDPGAATPLALLDAMPDPSQPARGDADEVVARLTDAGFADAGEALAELRQALAEDGDRPLFGGVGATVHPTVAAVRSCDAAAAALLGEIGERLDQTIAPADTAPAGQDWPPPVPTSSPGTGWPAADADAPSLGGPPSRAEDGQATLRLHFNSTIDLPERRLAAPGPADLPERRTAGAGPADLPERQPTAAGPADLPVEDATAERPTLPGEPEPPTLDMPTDFQPTVSNAGPATEERAGEDKPVIRDLGPVPTPRGLRSVSGRDENGSVTPLADTGAPRPRRGDLGSRVRRRNRAMGHELPTADLVAHDRPPREPDRELPGADLSGADRPPIDTPLDVLPDDPLGMEPTVAENDPDLLIFAAARSAWFAGERTDTEWDTVADEGWRAAEAAASPSVGTNTRSGLPRRVPQANLVPGSAMDEQERPPISRDASELAAQTAGYFRGWQRGRAGRGNEEEREPIAPTASEAFIPAGRR